MWTKLHNDKTWLCVWWKSRFEKLFRLHSENGHKLDSHRKHYSSASLKQRNFSFNDTLIPNIESWTWTQNRSFVRRKWLAYTTMIITLYIFIRENITHSSNSFQWAMCEIFQKMVIVVVWKHKNHIYYGQTNERSWPALRAPIRHVFQLFQSNSFRHIHINTDTQTHRHIQSNRQKTERDAKWER